MKVIITQNTALENEQAVNGFLKEYDYPESGIDEVAPGVWFGNIDAIKVGYEFILVKETADSDYYVINRRKNIEGLAIDERPVIIRGSEFKRIGCIESQEELDRQIKQAEMIRDIDKKTAAEDYQKALERAKTDYERTVARLDADAQAKIDRFNTEFAAYQNNEINYYPENNEPDDTDEEADLETEGLNEE